jgi:serine protease
VVASAGNDATNRPCYPAAFSLDPDEQSWAPVISVGAQNPSGTQALFSNTGRWVDTWVCGAAVVSTMPEFDAGATPLARRQAAGSTQARETLDPDDFLGGFGVWSGTSFAAPIVAGRIAAALIESVSLRTGDDRIAAARDAVDRVRAAITAENDALHAKSIRSRRNTPR